MYPILGNWDSLEYASLITLLLKSKTVATLMFLSSTPSLFLNLLGSMSPPGTLRLPWPRWSASPRWTAQSCPRGSWWSPSWWVPLPQPPRYPLSLGKLSPLIPPLKQRKLRLNPAPLRSRGRSVTFHHFSHRWNGNSTCFAELVTHFTHRQAGQPQAPGRLLSVLPPSPVLPPWDSVLKIGINLFECWVKLIHKPVYT